MFKWFSKAALLTALALLALSALIWWVGPLLAIAEWRPLEPTFARVLAVALLWLGWAARLAWRAVRQRRANAALLEGLSSGVSAIDRENEVLNQRFRDALDKLKGEGGRRSWLGGTKSIYQLPWYVFVGAPGSGKTTALQNAGLQFLLTDGAAGGAVKGIGGTRNCDWWFTREAVLIDTAGRYTTQESDSAVDASAWDRFLQLLRNTRPRRPINGVLLTINIQDLLQQGATERHQHAQKLRGRLHELQVKLGVTAPVYVLITKTDLLAGFNETFDTFNKEQRDQVWGFTFGLDAASDPLATFDADFTALEERLNSGLFARLQAERDGSKRTSIFKFPLEVANLRPVLREFLQGVFSSAGSLQEDVKLRGVYFTSGTQEGTPIDRVMGALSRSFGLQVQPASVAGRGKSFFLHRLLKDVIFTEQHLVSFNASSERRRTILRHAGFASVGIIVVALLAGWGVSWSRNQSYAQQVFAKVPELRQIVSAISPDPSGDVVPLSPALTAVRGAAQSPEFDIDSPPLLNTLGLYQGDKLDAGARIAYRKLLDHALLPRVTRRLEERLRGSSKNNLEQAYEALKSYLMLYTPEKFDADALKAWIAIDWDVNYGQKLSPEQRKALDGHLDALLAQGAPAAPAALDKQLVQSTREMLASFPLEYRIYSRIKRQYRGDVPEFTVAGAGGPNAQQVFERASGEPLSRGISGFYSKDGYHKAFQGSVQAAAAKLAAEEAWVLGKPLDLKLADMAGGELSDRVKRLYLQDYVKAWDSYLADVRLVKAAGVARSLEVARVLAAVDSPLAAYVRAIARETTLVPVPGPAVTGAVGQLATQAAQKKAELAALAGVQPAAQSGTGPIERIVDDHFAPMRRMVAGSPAPIDDVTKLFGEVHAQLQAVDSAIKSKSPPPPAANADRLKSAGATLPEPIRSMVTALADAGAKGSREGEREALSSELKPVFDFCSRAITNRYPFASGSQADVLPDDFGQLFGAGGMLDEFYQRRLAAIVDTGANPWRYKPLADGSKTPGSAALVEFQRAARIKEAFFRGGGKAPGFRMEMRAVEMSEGLKELQFDIDGQVLKFTPGNTSSAVVAWPSQKVSSRIRVSTVPAVTPVSFEGPWALFRMIDRFEMQPSAQPEKFTVQVNLEGKRARLEIIANSVLNPFRMREIQQFRCPGSL